MEKDLDQIDRKILTELQRDATLPIATLADKVGLSQTPCWKRQASSPTVSPWSIRAKWALA
jgi:DNA-binding Lrp family transcriptional regulator